MGNRRTKTSAALFGMSWLLTQEPATCRGKWQHPCPVAPIAVAYFPQNDQLEAFFIITSGALNVLYKGRYSAWEGPIGITSAGFATSGDSVVAGYYLLDTQLNIIVADASGQVHLVWKANTSTWRGPTPLG